MLGSATTPPFYYYWTNVPAGTYSLTARATDNLGATTTSSIINITVNAPGNSPPTVSISSPVNGATFTAPANITINANAADPGGSVSRVDFYQGTTLLGSDNSSPYSYVWSNVGVGNYSLNAKAIDNLAATTTSSSVSITVNNPSGNQPPVANPGGPYSGTPGSAIQFNGSGSHDNDGTISSYNWTFGDGGTGTGVTPVHTYSAAGTYTVTLSVTDDLEGVRRGQA